MIIVIQFDDKSRKDLDNWIRDVNDTQIIKDDIEGQVEYISLMNKGYADIIDQIDQNYKEDFLLQSDGKSEFADLQKKCSHKSETSMLNPQIHSYGSYKMMMPKVTLY